MAKPDAFPTSHHDHHRCIDDALQDAARVCAERGVRLTPQRRRVLELIWRSHEPVGAYAILEALREAGHKAAPPTVYRALDFLRDQGLVHRIESLNAYTGCTAPGTDHAGQFLVCNRCHTVAELADRRIARAVCEGAERLGFHAEQQTVEVHGLCPRCRETAG